MHVCTYIHRCSATLDTGKGCVRHFHNSQLHNQVWMCMCVRVCVCNRNKQTRRSPKLRAKITLRATHSYTHTETHWSVGVVVGVVEKRGKGRKQRCLPWFRSRAKIFAKFSQEFYMLLRLVKVFPTLFALFVNCCCFLMWRACVITFVFAFLPLCSFAVAFWHSDSLTLSHSHSHSHSLAHSGRHTADKLRDCQSCAQERKCKFR